MILAKRVKKAFAYDAQGKLSPVGENIFQFNRRRVVFSKKGRIGGHTDKDSGKRAKEANYEGGDTRSIG